MNEECLPRRKRGHGERRCVDMGQGTGLGGEVSGLDCHELSKGTVSIPVGQPEHLVTDAESRGAIPEGDDGP